jgi:hypothetical protein
MAMKILYSGLLNHVLTWKLAGETHCVVCVAKRLTTYRAKNVELEGTRRRVIVLYKCASPCLKWGLIGNLPYTQAIGQASTFSLRGYTCLTPWQYLKHVASKEGRGIRYRLATNLRHFARTVTSYWEIQTENFSLQINLPINNFFSYV